jgi:hypothetical protein
MHGSINIKHKPVIYNKIIGSINEGHKVATLNRHDAMKTSWMWELALRVLKLGTS